MKIERANPQKAALMTHPVCSFVRWNCVLKSPRMSPRTAKMIAVAMRAMQLATNICPGALTAVGFPVFVSELTIVSLLAILLPGTPKCP
jgi:hypothetical protein